MTTAPEETLADILAGSTPVARANHLRRLRNWHNAERWSLCTMNARAALDQYGLADWCDVARERRAELLGLFSKEIVP